MYDGPNAAARCVGQLVQSHTVGPLPRIAYIPDYITQDMEERLLRELQASKAKWTQVSLDRARLLLRPGTT